VLTTTPSPLPTAEAHVAELARLHGPRLWGEERASW
jgi:hypothetical protein